MSEDKHADNDPERTLVTLEQLSQTIEVMTSVVNRLRQHLSEQLQAQMTRQEAAALESEEQEAAAEESVVEDEQAPGHQDVLDAQQQHRAQQQQQRESFVVEIRQQDPEPVRKNNKTLH